MAFYAPSRWIVDNNNRLNKGYGLIIANTQNDANPKAHFLDYNFFMWSRVAKEEGSQNWHKNSHFLVIFDVTCIPYFRMLTFITFNISLHFYNKSSLTFPFPD